MKEVSAEARLTAGQRVALARAQAAALSYAVRMLEKVPGDAPALVIMGRAHLEGFERELKQHGFCRIELEAPN